MGYGAIIGVSTGTIMSLIIVVAFWMLWTRYKKSKKLNSPDEGIHLIV